MVDMRGCDIKWTSCECESARFVSARFERAHSKALMMLLLILSNICL